MRIECIIVICHVLLPPQKSDLTDLTEILESWNLSRWIRTKRLKISHNVKEFESCSGVVVLKAMCVQGDED